MKKNATLRQLEKWGQDKKNLIPNNRPWLCQVNPEPSTFLQTVKIRRI